MALDPLTIAKVATTIGKLDSSENGRWIILIAILTPLILVLFLLSSPFIIFSSLFSSGNSGDDISVQAYMLELQTEFHKKIEIEQQDPDMDSIKTKKDKCSETEILKSLNMARTTYYRKRKEAIHLFGVSLWVWKIIIKVAMLYMISNII